LLNKSDQLTCLFRQSIHSIGREAGSIVTMDRGTDFSYNSTHANNTTPAGNIPTHIPDVRPDYRPDYGAVAPTGCLSSKIDEFPAGPTLLMTARSDAQIQILLADQTSRRFVRTCLRNVQVLVEKCRDAGIRTEIMV
jgi:hypothetical protein